MDTATKTRGPMAANRGANPTGQDEAMRHREGPVARGIEEYTAQLPSDTFLWAAGASIAASVTLMATGNRHGALFVGQWAPTFLLLGIYNKIVKVAGSDRTEPGNNIARA